MQSTRTLSTIFLLSFLCITRLATATPNGPASAENGILDLTGWDFQKDGTVSLSGEYEFYWLEHFQPDDFLAEQPPVPDLYMPVPGVWNPGDSENRRFPMDGYATYRLTILLKAQTADLALKFLDMGTAFTVFVNGKEVLAVGTAGTTKASTRPYYAPQVVDIGRQQARLEIMYHVSNFHHRLGGAWAPVELGPKKEMYASRARKITFDLVLVGSILIVGLYQVGFFLLRRKDRLSLPFAAFCILVALRTLSTTEIYLVSVFPGLPWEILLKIEYLSFYLTIPVFSILLYNLFRREFSLVVHKGIVLFSALAALVVLVAPARVYSGTVIPYQVFTVLCLGYAAFVLMLSIRRKRKGAVPFFVGFVALAMALVNDILFYNMIISTGYLLHFGIMFFIFTQAFVLFVRFAKAFETVARQRSKLLRANRKYRGELSRRRRTQKKNAELRGRLEQSARMETLGKLAGGVAHDLNNILAGTVTYPDYLLNRIEPSNRLCTPLKTIRDSGLRASAVIQDLLMLARRGVVDFKPLSLNRVVEGYLSSPEHNELLEEHPNVIIESVLDAWLGNILGSGVHLAKVLMNLVRNAAEAQPDGGRIIISTNKIRLLEPLAAYEKIPVGEYAVLQVDDSGLGIAERNLRRIFQPFYTRKVMGRSGTGLGMAVVWGTVHDHSGLVDVKSMVGAGTTISLYFPITSQPVPATGPDLPLAAYKGNNETIFVVDDREEQREIASKVLAKLGYRVKTFASGEEVVENLKDSEVDLVLLDMIMENGIDGLETFKRILKRRPETKAIVASGFSETKEVKLAQELGAGAYLQKPYTLEEIGLAVRTELDK